MLSTTTRIRPGFNNGSTIDLDSPSFTNLKQTEMKAFDQCKFLNFGFVDLNAVDIEDEDTEKWTLDYTHLVPNLVKAIQELEAEVTTLRARITAEENR